MVVDNTVLYNLDDLHPHVGFDVDHSPIVCQLGGCRPEALAAAAAAVSVFPFDEINLNAGCPSRLYGSTPGSFGAALMREPDTVRDVVHAMARSSPVPVSVKCRVGVDRNFDSDEHLERFARVGLPRAMFVVSYTAGCAPYHTPMV
eukprot:Polyplicarium_translucidae@DN1887_c0_g1_i1.p1